MVGEHSRGLMYKLCEQRGMPLLVTDLIAGYLDRRDVLKLNTLSREISADANAMIYQKLLVELDGSKACMRKATLLLRTLLTNRRAAEAVCSLSLAGDPLLAWRQDEYRRMEIKEFQEDQLRGKTPPEIPADLTLFTARELGLYNEQVEIMSKSTWLPISQLCLWTLCLHILRLTPRVQSLSITSDYFRYPRLRRILEDTLEAGALPQLKSSRLCLDLLQGHHKHVDAVQDWDAALLTPFLVPSVDNITAVLALRPQVVLGLGLGYSSITRLTLHHYQTGESDFSALLAHTPQLRYLEYHVITEYGWLTSSRRNAASPREVVGLEPLFDALHHVADSLCELHTSHKYDEDSVHFTQANPEEHQPPFKQRRELLSTWQLHTLTIPYVTLLGWTRTAHEHQWKHILPCSLRRLTLTDQLSEHLAYDSWTDETLVPIFKGLVDWLSDVVSAKGDGEFGLRLKHATYDLDKAVRQDLVRRCNERGIRCSIEKVRQDRPLPSRLPTFRGRGRGGLTRGRTR